MPRTRAIGFTHHPELDGLRALGMFAIVFFHAGVQGWSNAFIALDMFFVLSGFLVAHVVLSEIDRTGSFSLGGFYGKRVRRLLPAAVVAIVGTCLITLLTSSQSERLDYIAHARAALLYVANWQFVIEARDYFAGDMAASPFMHYWSLSLEEQYYVGFALLVAVWLKLGWSRRILLGMLGVVFLASLLSQVVGAHVDPDRAYFATDARVFQIVAGAIAAVAVRSCSRTIDQAANVCWPRLGPILATTGVAGYVLLGSPLLTLTNSHRNIVATALALAMVVGMYAAPRSAVTRFASLPVLVYLGAITYSIYLWHWPLVLLLGRYLTVRDSVIAMLALLIATALASLSYELLENPIRRARRLNPFGWQVAIGGTAVGVLAAVFLVGPVLSSERSPAIVLADTTDGRVSDLNRQRELDKRLDRPVPELDLVAAKNSRGPGPQWCAPRAPDDCLLVDGDGLRVVLVGDSHARVVGAALQALAEEHRWRLSLSVSAGCPFQQGVMVTGSAGGSRPDCEEARQGFYTTTLPAMKPDLVVFSAAAQSDPAWHGVVADEQGRTEDPKRILAQATRRTVQLAHDAGAAVIMIKTMAGTDGWGTDGFDPLSCLAQAKVLRDCAVQLPPDRPAEDAIYEAIAIEDDRAAVIDPTRLYCPDAVVCAPVLRGTIVWRNPDHLTAEVLTDRRGVLWRQLKGTGLLARG